MAEAAEKAFLAFLEDDSALPTPDEVHTSSVQLPAVASSTHAHAASTPAVNPVPTPAMMPPGTLAASTSLQSSQVQRQPALDHQQATAMAKPAAGHHSSPAQVQSAPDAPAASGSSRGTDALTESGQLEDGQQAASSSTAAAADQPTGKPQGPGSSIAPGEGSRRVQGAPSSTAAAKVWAKPPAALTVKHVGFLGSLAHALVHLQHAAEGLALLRTAASIMRTNPPSHPLWFHGSPDPQVLHAHVLMDLVRPCRTPAHCLICCCSTACYLHPLANLLLASRVQCIEHLITTPSAHAGSVALVALVAQ